MSKQVDGVFRTRSLGVSAQGLPDQYADGKAAQVWSLYVGSAHSRTERYREWLVDFLRNRNTRTVVDVACGTGIDSIMLLEKGFAVTSCDASDKMLKYALKERWNRRKEPAFDQWVIEEANWLTLEEDFKSIPHPEEGFDAVVCLGNSFPHLPDFDGSQTSHRQALANFWQLVAPGGVLVVDHRNYDEILDTGVVPVKNLYYNSDHVEDIKCSNLYVNGKPKLTTLDYKMDVTGVKGLDVTVNQETGRALSTFRLSYYPHRLQGFSDLLRSAVGSEAEHTVLADFKPLSESASPAYYIHVVHKPQS